MFGFESLDAGREILALVLRVPFWIPTTIVATQPRGSSTQKLTLPSPRPLMD